MSIPAVAKRRWKLAMDNIPGCANKANPSRKGRWKRLERTIFQCQTNSRCPGLIPAPETRQVVAHGETVGMVVKPPKPRQGRQKTISRKSLSPHPGLDSIQLVRSPALSPWADFRCRTATPIILPITNVEEPNLIDRHSAPRRFSLLPLSGRFEECMQAKTGMSAYLIT